MNCVANVILGDFQWLVLYIWSYTYELLTSLLLLLNVITDSQFTRDITQVEHWRTVCRGRPCTRRTLVAESPSALLYSSVLLCMALLLQIAVLMVFIWPVWLAIQVRWLHLHKTPFSSSGSLFLTTQVGKDWECMWRLSLRDFVLWRKWEE